MLLFVIESEQMYNEDGDYQWSEIGFDTDLTALMKDAHPGDRIKVIDTEANTTDYHHANFNILKKIFDAQNGKLTIDQEWSNKGVATAMTKTIDNITRITLTENITLTYLEITYNDSKYPIYACGIKELQQHE